MCRDADVLRLDEELRCENAARKDGESDGRKAHKREPSDFAMTGEEGFDGCEDREGGGVVAEEGVLGRGTVDVGEVGKGLESAEGVVEWLEEEEEDHADEGGEKAVEEVGGGEAVGGGWSGKKREEAVLDCVVDERDGDEGDEEDDGCNEPSHDVGFFEEPGDEAIAVGVGFEVGFAGVVARSSLGLDVAFGWVCWLVIRHLEFRGIVVQGIAVNSSVRFSNRVERIVRLI